MNANNVYKSMSTNDQTAAKDNHLATWKTDLRFE